MTSGVLAPPWRTSYQIVTPPTLRVAPEPLGADGFARAGALVAASARATSERTARTRVGLGIMGPTSAQPMAWAVTAPRGRSGPGCVAAEHRSRGTAKARPTRGGSREYDRRATPPGRD